MTASSASRRGWRERPDEGAPTAVAIQARIGRRPIPAGGDTILADGSGA